MKYYQQEVLGGVKLKLEFEKQAQQQTQTQIQNHHHRAYKIAHPTPYKGNRTEFSNFIMQLHLVFNSDPPCYSTDAQKISYAASYLDGTAKDWFRPNVNANTGAISFPTCTAFVDAFKAAFDNTDAMATAERKLMVLK